MADVKWIKIVTDIFDDEKIKELEKYSGADSIICLWLNILFRSKPMKNKNIRLFKIGNINLNDDILKNIFRYKNGDIRNELVILENLGFIKRNEKSIELNLFWQENRDRNTTCYKEWRKKVFDRDKYTCQKCGTKKELQAHHIVPWKSCTKEKESLKYSVDNGITLCRSCHLKEHGGCWRERY